VGHWGLSPEAQGHVGSHVTWKAHGDPGQLGRTLLWEHGFGAEQWHLVWGTMRAPQPALVLSVPQPLCPSTFPLPPPSALTSPSVLFFLCLSFLQISWLSLLSLLSPS